MKYQAMLIIEVELEASSNQAARDMLGSAIDSSLCAPRIPSCAVTNCDIRLKRMGTPDRRLTAHLPDVSRSSLIMHLKRLDPMQLAVVAFCHVKPRHLAAIYTMMENAARQQGIDYTIEQASADIAYLRNEGWLISVVHEVPRDTFPSLDVRAALTGLATGG